MNHDHFQPETLYDLLGGDAGVRQLVDRFYDIMDREPEVASIEGFSKSTPEEVLSLVAGAPSRMS